MMTKFKIVFAACLFVAEAVASEARCSPTDAMSGTDANCLDSDSCAALSLLQVSTKRTQARQHAGASSESSSGLALVEGLGRAALAACARSESSGCAKAAAGLTERLLSATPADCDLCGGDQQWLFVLAGGRSGSTTVLSMLNAIPGMHLAGENWGAVNSLLELYKSANSTGFGHSSGVVDAWTHTEISERRVLCAMQDYIRVIVGEFDGATTKYIGFKEIRHKTPEQINFFSKVFPCAKYVINTRDVDEQHKSGWFKEMPLEKLEAKKVSLESFSATHGESAFDLPLEDFSVERFNSLLHWLGVDGCAFTQVAHANDGGYAGSVGPGLEGTCRFQAADSAAQAPAAH